MVQILSWLQQSKLTEVLGSYPGYDLDCWLNGAEVETIQEQLNRIAQELSINT